MKERDQQTRNSFSRFQREQQ